jgi:ribA/ribD-fused uncharacterized protein
MTEILFYRANEKPYGAFSNLYRREIKVRNIVFPTAEHAYQSLKARDASVASWLLSAPSPSLLAIAAHVLPSDETVDPSHLMKGVSDSLLGFHTRPGWSRLRYPWMLECLRMKFGQHEDLRNLLLSTKDSPIIEEGRIDDDAGRRWGRVNGRGHNYLGRMLMRVRQDLGGASVKDQDLDTRLLSGVADLETAVSASHVFMKGGSGVVRA